MATQPVIHSGTPINVAGLPEGGSRYEVIAGELSATEIRSPHHQYALGGLVAEMGRFAREEQLGWVLPGPVDVLLAQGDHFSPDLVFVRRERGGIITDRGIVAAPNLVVEVLSPGTADRDRGVKRQRYAWYGIPEYWVVDLDVRQVEVHRMIDERSTPNVVRDELRWIPIQGGPILRIDVQGALRNEF